MSGHANNETKGSDYSSKWASEDLGIDDSFSNFGKAKEDKDKAKAEFELAATGGLHVPYDTKEAAQKKWAIYPLLHKDNKLRFEEWLACQERSCTPGNAQ